MRLRENIHMVPRSAWLGMAVWCAGFIFLAVAVVCSTIHAVMERL